MTRTQSRAAAALGLALATTIALTACSAPSAPSANSAGNDRAATQAASDAAQIEAAIRNLIPEAEALVLKSATEAQLGAVRATCTIRSHTGSYAADRSATGAVVFGCLAVTGVKDGAEFGYGYTVDYDIAANKAIAGIDH